MERTSHTAEASTVHEPFGSPSGPGLFHHKGLQLPAYIQHVAHRLLAHGLDESRAIAEAIGIVRDWAHGHDGHGNKVSGDVQAAAAKAMAQWEADKASAGKSETRRAAVTVTRAQMSTAEINNLPDSDFAYIEPGGTKDSTGRTVPRDLRHLPLHDAAHIRDALGRLPQSDLSPEQKAQAMKKIRARAQKAGVEVADDSGYGSGGSMSRSLVRPWPLEDIHIVSRADGDGSGRMVEAYATVFDTPVEIRDHQGHYQEIIDRAAFDRTLERIRRGRGGIAGAIRVLYNHGKTMEGMPAPEFQRPIGKPVDIHPDGRGLVTRTEYAKTPLAEEILDDIREGRITAQSFEGPELRSDPPLRGPGDRYRKRGGVLPVVRRMSLGLLNYGPALFAANPHAEFLGIVRMSIPGTDDVLDYTDDEEFAPAEGDGTGSLPEDGFPSRSHAHRRWQLHTEELCRQAGIPFEEN